MTVPRFCLPIFCLLLLAACGRQSETPAAAPLSYQTADGDTVPIRPLAEAGTDFLVRYDEEETMTAAGPVYRPRYALISQQDYDAGKPNWRPVSGF